MRAAVLAVKNHTDNAENRVNSFSMRPEQQEAVDKTAAYFQSAYDEDSTRLLQIFVELQNALWQNLCVLSVGRNEWDSRGF